MAFSRTNKKMIRASNVVLCSFSLRHIVKNKSIKNRSQQCILEGARKWGSWGTNFLFFVSFVPIFRVEQDVNKWTSHCTSALALVPAWCTLFSLPLSRAASVVFLTCWMEHSDCTAEISANCRGAVRPPLTSSAVFGAALEHGGVCCVDPKAQR